MNDKDILLAALERAAAAESMLRRLVDETENDGFIGWEERMTKCIADANKLLAGKFIDGSGACNTCGGHGMIGGHSGQTPEQYEEWQETCPDCEGKDERRLPGAGGGDALDAARYRGLRNGLLTEGDAFIARLNDADTHPKTAEQFDAAIDAAIGAALPPQQGG